MFASWSGLVALAGGMLCGGPAAGLTINVTDPVQVISAQVGRYVTTLNPHPPTYLPSASTGTIPALFATDYPGQTYHIGGARMGVLTISTLDAVQTGTQGGLDIVASFDGAAADHTYRWLQYIEWSPIGDPFRGETSSPFTDPPLLDLDDSLPFYWTNAQRATAGLGWVTGEDQDDNPRFSDGPRANNSRAVVGSPFSFTLNLLLSDYDASTERVTIYDGVSYGFKIKKVSESPTAVVLLLSLGILLCLSRFRRTW
jgi:hypothetical protein